MAQSVCVNCGAPLRIGGDGSALACQYCGSHQARAVKGDEDSVSGIEAALNVLKNEAARAAAELAMPRLNAELAALDKARRTALHQAEEHAKTARRHRWLMALIVFLAAVFAGRFVISGHDGLVRHVLKLVWTGLCAVAPVAAFFKLKLPEEDTAKALEDIDKRLQDVRARIAATRAILEQLPND